jgi:hypothetical protein
MCAGDVAAVGRRTRVTVQARLTGAALWTSNRTVRPTHFDGSSAAEASGGHVAQAPDGRTPAQVADEKAMAHISAVLTNLDWTIERARKGIKELRKADAEEARNAELALADLLAQLEPVRKRFFQGQLLPGRHRPPALSVRNRSWRGGVCILATASASSGRG